MCGRLGRRILRPLLRSELGEVSNRRAWAEPGRLTPEIVALYSEPLRVQGWDAALLEARAPGHLPSHRVLGDMQTGLQRFPRAHSWRPLCRL